MMDKPQLLLDQNFLLFKTPRNKPSINPSPIPATTNPNSGPLETPDNTSIATTLHPFGVFALVVTLTRELAFQLAEQFRALGSSLHLRIAVVVVSMSAVVVGGMDMLKQTKELVARPHLVIATPGRIHLLLRDNPDIPPVFSRTKFLVQDEAD